MRRLIYLPVALAAYWAIAQTGPAPMAAIFPAGASVYVEARDFGALLRDWDASSEKAAWLASANYEAFSRSKVFLRLVDAQKEFAAAAGVPADYAMVGAAAGSNSALAIYDIGDLQFLYATRLGSARATETGLWKARARYETRRAGGVDYYVKRDAASGRIAAFAIAGDTLLLATNEEIIAGALELMARASRPAIASEKWFEDATRAAGGQAELRLAYNLDRLLRDSHFRSYWIERNSSALREFSAGISDLQRSSGRFVERRVLLRANATPAVVGSGAQLMAMVPDDAGFYRMWATPSPEQAGRVMVEKFFAKPGLLESIYAPVIGNSGEAGSEQDLETRVDVAPLKVDRDAETRQKLSAALAGKRISAMLEVSRSVIGSDQVFIGTESAVLLAGDSFDESAFAGDGLFVAARDGMLIVSNSREWTDAILRQRGNVGADAVYAAGWRHARELPNFERMTRLIDFPQIPPTGDAREPMFFSENLASLGRVLRRVESAEIVMRDEGSLVRETVNYRIAP